MLRHHWIVSDPKLLALAWGSSPPSGKLHQKRPQPPNSYSEPWWLWRRYRKSHMLGHILGCPLTSVVTTFNFFFFFETTVESQDMALRSTVPFPRSLAVTPDTTLCCSIEAITHCYDQESDIGTRRVEFSDTWGHITSVSQRQSRFTPMETLLVTMNLPWQLLVFHHWFCHVKNVLLMSSYSEGSLGLGWLLLGVPLTEI